MAYATENFDEAEKLIRNNVYNHCIGKVLEISQWLLSLNGQEKHRIKCYQTFGKRPDIRFCIDKGSDCDGQKIMTCFVVIEPNFEIGGLYTRNPKLFSYFKPDTTRRWRINSSDTSNISMEKIREHILESYLLKAEDLNLSTAFLKAN